MGDHVAVAAFEYTAAVEAEPRIETARPEHLEQVIALAGAYQLQSMEPERAKEHGFLVSGFTDDEYREFLTRADHFRVLLAGDEVLGFVLAYSSDRIASNEWMNLKIKSESLVPFVLIKQICVLPAQIGGKAGTMLYRDLIDRVPDRPLFTVIVADPPNPRSIAFHEKLGFEKVFEATPPDGFPRSIWRRNSSAQGR
jgi:predicted GNAT superfamily acetyltransferase